MKLSTVLASVALAFGSAMALVSTANADTYVTPLVGYQFQTSDTKGKQEASLGEFQKNHATYGVRLTQSVGDQNQVGLQYTQVDSNLDSYSVGLVGTTALTQTLYAVGGAGYTKLDGTVKSQEGAYVSAGLGAQLPLTNMLTVKTEIGTNFLVNSSQWVPTALVGLQFNIGQVTKPYSAK